MLYRVIAFGDNVGYACCLAHGERVAKDVRADTGADEAEVGLDLVSPWNTRVLLDGYCMDCGKALKDAGRKPHAERLDANDESRNRATHHGEPWSVDELEFLKEFWRTDPERDVAEALGRTIEACRQRFYEYLHGQGPSGMMVRRVVTTTTTTEYIGLHDDPDDRWWSPDYYTEK